MTNEMIIKNIKEAKLILLCNNIVELIIVIHEGRKQGLYKNKFWDLDNDEELDLDKLKEIAIELVLKELDKQDNRIKELESDKEIKDKTIREMTEFISNTDITHNICAEEGCYDDDDMLKGCQSCIKQYFENLAKESGEIDEDESN